MYCRNCGKDVVATAEFCPSCGARPSSGKGFCNACGGQVSPAAEMCMKCGTRLAMPQAAAASGSVIGGISPKSKLVTFLLSTFLGYIGIHRFYVGKTGTGIVMIVLFLCFGVSSIWNLIDWIMILMNKFKDKNGLVVSEWSPK
jgi:TM2 domain-containing membrane protein YozV